MAQKYWRKSRAYNVGEIYSRESIKLMNLCSTEIDTSGNVNSNWKRRTKSSTQQLNWLKMNSRLSYNHIIYLSYNQYEIMFLWSQCTLMYQNCLKLYFKLGESNYFFQCVTQLAYFVSQRSKLNQRLSFWVG